MTRHKKMRASKKWWADHDADKTKGDSSYADNVKAERDALVRKQFYSQVRVNAKVTGARFMHIRKLLKHALRAGGI